MAHWRRTKACLYSWFCMYKTAKLLIITKISCTEELSIEWIWVRCCRLCWTMAWTEPTALPVLTTVSMIRLPASCHFGLPFWSERIYFTSSIYCRSPYKILFSVSKDQPWGWIFRFSSSTSLSTIWDFCIAIVWFWRWPLPETRLILWNEARLSSSELCLCSSFLLAVLLFWLRSGLCSCAPCGESV